MRTPQREDPIRFFIPALVALCACDAATSSRDAEVQALVEKEFARLRPAGAVGTEVQGKGIWYRTPVFDGLCLQDKSIGIRDQGRGGAPASKSSEGIRISPRYGHQNDWTASTEKGYCIYLGENLTMNVKNVTQVGDAWVVDVAYNLSMPSDWWQCVAADQRSGTVRVEATDDGTLVLGSDVGLTRGACPHPLPAEGRDRTAAKRPKGKAPKPPTVADAKAALGALDDALWNGDFSAALSATACYNLFETTAFGACSIGEVLGVGPIQRGEMRMQDGPPWTANAFKSLDEIGPIKADKKDKTLFHVRVAAASGKRKARHASVQWVDGAWKVVGIVQRLGEGLTYLEYVNDLDRNDKREIFERRAKGEKIDADGQPVHPDVQQR